MWEGKGISFAKLIDELINIAIITHKEKDENIYSYDSDLFNKISYGGKMKKV